MIDLKSIKTIPIEKRKNKFKIEDMISLDSKVDFSDDKLNDLSIKIIDSFKKKKPIILMMGAHLIKVGCSLFIIELMKKGIIKHIAMNGAGPIHDFEIALIGQTSEYVEQNIENGTFGMSYETGKIINDSIKEGSDANLGYGLSIGRNS